MTAAGPEPTANINTADGITLSVDAMGGDLGPEAVVKGVAKFLREFPDCLCLLHGDEVALSKFVQKRNLSGKVTIVPTHAVIAMTDKPSHALRHGKGSSMWSAIESVREGAADVCVSGGNTGALMAISMLRLRKADGVNRPAIAGLWPSRNKAGFNVLLDAGADIRADQNDLLTYALMGASYARNSMGIDRPRIGLLNVGVEEHKGRAELKLAQELIQDASKAGAYDYIGFVEGTDLPSDRVDVIVTDGFTGNVALKTGEGTARLISEFLREAFRYTPLSRVASLLALTSLRRLGKRIDPRRVNGGVFLGLGKTVIKSHGSSDATGIAAALMLAHRLASSNFSEKLAARVASAATLAQEFQSEDTPPKAHHGADKMAKGGAKE